MAIDFNQIIKNADNMRATKKVRVANIFEDINKVIKENFIIPLRKTISDLFTEEALQSRLEYLLANDETFKEDKYINIQFIDSTQIVVGVDYDLDTAEENGNDKLTVKIKHEAMFSDGVEMQINGNLYCKDIPCEHESISIVLNEQDITFNDLLEYFYGDDKNDSDEIIYLEPVLNDSEGTVQSAAVSELEANGFKVLDANYRDASITLINPFYSGD